MVMIMDNNFRIGQRIRQLRSERGLSQEQLALKAEITTAYLGMLERGEKNPTVVIVEKICFALGVSLVEFFSDSFKPNTAIDELSMQILHQLDGKTAEEKQAVLAIIKQVFKIQDLTQ